MKKTVLMLAMVVSIVSACGQKTEASDTHHDLLVEMMKATMADNNSVFGEKKAQLTDVFASVLDTIPAGQSLSADQRRERASELTSELFDLMAEQSVLMIEPYVERYVGLDTLRQYVEAYTTQPVLGLMIKTTGINQSVAESISMELMQVMAGDSLPLPTTECSDAYRQNFQKVMDMCNADNAMEDAQAALVGTDRLQAVRNYTNAAVLKGCVEAISEDEMAALAAFADMPCTQAYVAACKRMGQSAMAAMGGEGSSDEDAQLLIEVSNKMAGLMGRMQRWFADNLPGASEDVILQVLQ